ncbi:hypothetical protein LshimejAT787_0101460 [Lyophyllum shimeji]|uniref:Uncharacterized protein n=1 Tax=Lyophyllum shimeji TaxID=47721 RepID=A0A9P3PCJ2_LYOSH|nr:hypothetical protein LshimejAT787_0101460 [Lyophyllum shimeji]
MSHAQRVRYHSLHEAVYDNTQPEFDPRACCASDTSAPTSGSNVLGGYPPAADTSYDGVHNPLPSPALYPGGLPKPHKRHPFAKGFEAPLWKNILVHIALCLIAYPFLLLITLVARQKSLFWTRFIVGMGCGLIGFCLGLSLLQLAQSHLEAATWAMVIHQSRVDTSPGVRLRDLAASSGDPTSAWSGLRLLWDRAMYPGTSRRSRGHYDSRPWSLVILFFLALVGIAASLPFILGRLVDINAVVIHQREYYDEVAILGDNSDADIARATELKPRFDDFALTWTLAPFSTHGGLPPVVSFDWNGDTVYFSETILSQLLSNGSGFGTFATETADPSLKLHSTTQPTGDAIEPGAVLRFPRWGTRIHCAKIPDPEINIITRSLNTFTYVFTPRAVLESLFTSFGMGYPTTLMPFNASKVLQLNDTLPVGLDPAQTALGAAFYDNGVGHSFFSSPVSTGEDGNGWVSIEEVLVRLNTTYTPKGKFPRKSDVSVPDKNGGPTWIGYDAAVCVQLFEPWVLEVFNSTTGLPSSMKIVEKGNEIRSMDTAQTQEKLAGWPVTDPDVNRQLNSSRLADVYACGHTNSVNQMLKDNGRDAFYVPSPTVVSFTDGKGSLGYTELSEKFFAQARGLADASNVLPYFAGSGKTLARRYNDRVLSSASVNPVYMGTYVAFILVVGLVAGFFVPKLPLDVPHRGFEVYSWIAAFHADELIGVGSNTGIARNMELDEIEERMGDLKFRYVNTQESS